MLHFSRHLSRKKGFSCLRLHAKLILIKTSFGVSHLSLRMWKLVAKKLFGSLASLSGSILANFHNSIFHDIIVCYRLGIIAVFLFSFHPREINNPTRHNKTVGNHQLHYTIRTLITLANNQNPVHSVMYFANFINFLI